VRTRRVAFAARLTPRFGAPYDLTMRFSSWSARRSTVGALLLASASLSTLPSCARQSDAPDARLPGIDVGVDAFTAAVSCTTPAECDDGFPCTIDTCGVGNVCSNRPRDSLCNDGETCVVGRGCVTGMPMDCMVDDDCDDGRRCTGREQCLLGMCRVTEEYVCDDGNSCTEDSCGGPSDDCVFTTICDSGIGGFDAGPLCTAFEASSVYSGTFVIPMAPSQGCGTVPTYTASPVTFSVSGGTLTARATGITMTQSPAPTGADLDVREDRGCAHFRLTGTFSCGNQGMGTFTATFDSGCEPCADQTRSVTLLR
jgi:hypothetical protein